MTMLITNLLRNTIQATNFRAVFNQFHKRSLSTNVKTSAEKAQASIESQQAILGKIHSYMEEKSHRFGGWYYALSLTGIAVGIIGTGIFRSSKILDKRIEDATKDIRKDIADIRKDTGNLEKNLNIRIDHIEKNFNTRVDHMEKNFNTRMDNMEKNFNTRMDNIEQNISEMRSDIREIRSLMIQQYRQPIPAENTRQLKV